MTEIPNTSNPMQSYSEDEIDYIGITKKIWKGRNIILIITLIFMISGFIAAITAPIVYTTSAAFVPQTSTKGGGMEGLRNLAALAGFNTGMELQKAELSPSVYPQIIKSTSYQLNLIQQPIHFEGESKPISMLDYYSNLNKPLSFSSKVKKYTIGLPTVVMNGISGLLMKGKKNQLSTISDSLVEGPIIISEKIDNIRQIAASAISINLEERKGYITLTASFSEARACADLAQNALTLLQKYITKIKIQKAQEQLLFIQERYNDTKIKYEKAQEALAIATDRNQNVISNLSKTREERLRADYNLAFGVFMELSKQLEQARIQVNEDTPVFSIINPVMVPLERDAPSRFKILIIWTFVGIFFGIGWVFGVGFFKKFREKWRNEEPRDKSQETNF